MAARAAKVVGQAVEKGQRMTEVAEEAEETGLVTQAPPQLWIARCLWRQGLDRENLYEVMSAGHLCETHLTVRPASEISQPAKLQIAHSSPST